MTTHAVRPSTPLVDLHERVVDDARERLERIRAGGVRPGRSPDGQAPDSTSSTDGRDESVSHAGSSAAERIGLRLEWLPYGPPREHGEPLRLVGSYGSVELEYAAIRRGAGLLDAAHRGTVEVIGGERIAFLNRMITQQVADLPAGSARAAFWLNRKGRIDADLLVAQFAPADGDDGDECTLVDLDRHVAATTAESLTRFVFSEDVSIRDATERRHRIALHGRSALETLATVAGPEFAMLPDLHARRGRVAGVAVRVIRRDQCGEPGLEIDAPVEGAADVWRALGAVDGVRPIGWHAYNIARIEAGTPLFNVDFDTTSLPHESGVLRDRVSFTKGCYLGQEVVARMESLGKPKQTLVGLRVERRPGAAGDPHAAFDVLPEAGSTVCLPDGEADDPEAVGIGPQVGAVTSSTLSPMLAAAPIAMAMVRSAHAVDGQRLLVFGDGLRAFATVGPLRAWGRRAEDAGPGGRP